MTDGSRWEPALSGFIRRRLARLLLKQVYPPLAELDDQSIIAARLPRDGFDEQTSTTTALPQFN